MEYKKPLKESAFPSFYDSVPLVSLLAADSAHHPVLDGARVVASSQLSSCHASHAKHGDASQRHMLSAPSFFKLLLLPPDFAMPIELRNQVSRLPPPKVFPCFSSSIYRHHQTSNETTHNDLLSPMQPHHMPHSQ